MNLIGPRLHSTQREMATEQRARCSKEDWSWDAHLSILFNEEDCCDGQNEIRGSPFSLNKKVMDQAPLHSHYRKKGDERSASLLSRRIATGALFLHSTF